MFGHALYLTRCTLTICMQWIRYFKGVVLWAGLGAPFYIEHVHVKFAK